MAASPRPSVDPAGVIRDPAQVMVGFEVGDKLPDKAVPGLSDTA